MTTFHSITITRASAGAAPTWVPVLNAAIEACLAPGSPLQAAALIQEDEGEGAFVTGALTAGANDEGLVTIGGVQYHAHSILQLSF